MSLFSRTPGSPSIPAPLAHQAPQPAPVSQSPMATQVSSALAPLTEDDVKRALPANLRSSVTQALVDTFNNISTDPMVAQNIRDNFIGYSAVLREGKFKTEDYLHAVAYVSFKLMNYSNQDAYARAFPARYANLIGKGASAKDISAYVSAYHKGKLVNLIMEQSLVPSWVLNQDIYQKAINVQAELMLNAVSEKVRCDAANSLLTHLQKPAAAKNDISLTIPESSGMKEMKDLLTKLASQQRELIAQGEMKTIDVAGSRLIDKTAADDAEDHRHG